MATLYRSNVFIEREKALPIINAGAHFLKAYARLAFLCHEERVSRYALTPKAHMFFHIVANMREELQHAPALLNPIVFSTASDEDFIGRFCFLTRCVSPRQRILRSMQRYLTQVYLWWARACTDMQS